MDFDLTEEQVKFRESVIEFARRNADGDVLERDKAGEFSRDQWRKWAEFGIHGLPIPEVYGGTDQDVITTMLGMEALGYGCRDHGLLFSIHAHMWAVEIPILAFGTEDQKRRYLPRLCDGSLVGAHGMSEPDSGSDAFKLRTHAELHADHYVLNGTKTFVTNAPVADIFVVFATVDPAKGMWGVTAFVLERGMPGLSVSKNIEKMGLTTSPMGEVVLQDCRVPVEHRLGREGQGAPIFNHSMGWERSCILASTVGGMERQLETCLAHVKSRRQFGKPIGNFQLVASKIVDMKLRVETSRLLLYRAAWATARNQHTVEPELAKLYISECAVASSLDAIQVHGGYGYTREFGVERQLRDAIGGTLYSGTSEMQRLIVARHLGLSPLA